MASGFAGGNQVMGAPKTADFLEKASWTLIAVIVVLSIIAVGISKGSKSVSADESAIIEQVEEAVAHAKLGIGSGKPTMIILNTLKGCGVQWIVDLGSGNHNCPVTEEQAAAAIREIRGED